MRAGSDDPFGELPPPPAEANVSLLVRGWAERTPSAPAVRTPTSDGAWSELDYAALEEEVDRAAAAFARAGVRPRDRAAVFVRPGAALTVAAYALFRLGAVPVLIDPGMGRRRLLACVARVRPRALVGVRAALVARRLFPRAFRSVEVACAAPRPGERRGAAPSPRPFAPEPLPAEAEAAVLFTSGSTGPAKGAVYTSAVLHAQTAALRALYGLEPGEVDVACFPLFALFDVALGMTSVFPDVDLARPAACDPARVVHALVANDATLSFGSPAVWRRVVPWLRETRHRVPALSRVLVAGAPVPPGLAAEFQEVLEGGADVHTPYGATEALPVASISGREIVALRGRAESGEGTCVGRVAPGIELRLLRIADEPFEALSDDLLAAPGEPGEIAVRGPAVTRAYADEPELTRRAKLDHRDGSTWHRMGDVGALDGDGRLWFHGRAAHRIQTHRGTLMPVPQENIFNTHPAVRRSALVSVGRPGEAQPVLVVETERPVRHRALRDALALEIAAHGSGIPGRCNPRAVLFKDGFPVDVRHNAKIHRGELSRWASRRLR